MFICLIIDHCIYIGKTIILIPLLFSYKTFLKSKFLCKLLSNLQIWRKWRKDCTLRCNGYPMWLRVADWCMLWWQKYTMLAKFTILGPGAKWLRVLDKLPSSGDVMNSRRMQKTMKNEASRTHREVSYVLLDLNSF